MLNRVFNNRYSLLFSFIIVFVLTSFLIRAGLLVTTFSKLELTFKETCRIFFLGFNYDLGVALMLSGIYNLYLLIVPTKWVNSVGDRVLTYGGLFLTLFISYFSFFAELTFWQEFESRFNFIAVDYLIYTYEVISNINESYPLPLLIGGVVLMTLFVIWILIKTGNFYRVFHSKMPFKHRLIISAVLLIVTLSYPFLLSNDYAESSRNHYQNELSKAGIYSFFSAFKSNELNYKDFYALLPKNQAYQIIRKELVDGNSRFNHGGTSVRRIIHSDVPMSKPNVIMITVESLSADFMAHFGNNKNLMPILDSLADHNLLFNNMYATGTRTVRGMEALSLGVPPTPGSSIVRRQNNQNLTTVGNIFKKAGYSRTFYYGGDGYFDNMNEYFGSNGFDITDRGRNIKMNDTYSTKRTIISDDQVHFKNAWGICDEDLFDAVIRGADNAQSAGKPFYDFVMTTSNHRPFTFPNGRIAFKSGTREAALRYTDYAIGRFLKTMQQKAWYKNTVIIIVADHCAGSAGKNEVEISKYHIPCLVLNLSKHGKQVIDKMCSQIDLYPTLFSLLGWNYESNLFGKNVLDPNFQPRAMMGTYQKLAYLKSDSLVILSPQRRVETFLYNVSNDSQKSAHLPAELVNHAIANYQTAYELFKNGGLHQ